MTTIAANKDTIACDLQFTTGTIKLKGGSKITEVGGTIAKELFGVDRVLIGYCGTAAELGNMNRWLSNPTTKPPVFRNGNMLMLSKRGLFFSENLIDWHPVNQKYYAMGSGGAFALGALEAGKTPLEAVKVASKHDAFTGMGFKEYKL